MPSPFAQPQQALPGNSSDRLKDKYSSQADDGTASDKKREAAMLFSVAEGHLEDGALEEALTSAGDALHLFRDMEDNRGIGDATRVIIHAYRQMAERAKDQEDMNGALAKLQEADRIAQEELQLFRDTGDKHGEAGMYLAIAELNLERRHGDHGEDPLDAAEEAVRLFKQLQQESMEAKAHLEMSRIYVKRNNFTLAKRIGAEAISTYKRIGDKTGEAMAWDSLGQTAYQDFCYDEAIRCGRRALKLAQELGNRKTEALAMHELARWSVIKGDAHMALQMATAALAIFQQVNYGRGYEASALGCIIEAHVMSNNIDPALEIAKDQVDKVRERDEHRELVNCLMHMAYVQSASGNLEEALLTEQEAYSVCQSKGLRRLESRSLENQAFFYTSMKNREMAIRSAKEAVDILRELELPEHECKGRMFIEARIYVMNNAFAEAAQAAKQALELARDIGDMKLEGQAMLAVCTCYAVQSNSIDKAIKAGELAAEIFKEVGGNYKIDQAKAYQAQAECHAVVGDYSAALRSAKQSELLLTDFGDRRRLARMKHTTVNILTSCGDFEEATRVAMEALKIMRSEDDSRGTVLSLFVVINSSAMALAQEGEPKPRRIYTQNCEKAIRLAKEAISISIKLGDHVSESDGFCWVAFFQLLMDKLNEAKQSANSALSQAKAAGEQSSQAWAMLLLATASFRSRDSPGALTLLSEAHVLAKSADASDILLQIEELQAEITGAPARAAPTKAPTSIDVPGDADAPGAAASVAVPGGGEIFQAPDPAMVKQFIVGLVVNMTGSQDEVEADVPLMESGIDSLASVELRTQLQKEFRVNLPSTVIFNFPTISSMSQMLVEECTNKKIAWSS